MGEWGLLMVVSDLIRTRFSVSDVSKSMTESQRQVYLRSFDVSKRKGQQREP